MYDCCSCSFFLLVPFHPRMTDSSTQPRTPGGSVLSAIPWLANTQFTKVRLRELFNEFDKDNNNVIDMSELQEFAYSLWEVWSNETCQKIFDKLDTDKSGGLDIYEFSAWFLTPGAVDEVSKDDDFLTKFALGPELFLRRAKRKASEATKLLSSHPMFERVLIRSSSGIRGYKLSQLRCLNWLDSLAFRWRHRPITLGEQHAFDKGSGHPAIQRIR